ncbi:hypothetical protein ACFL2O_07765, partial [Thermodesulfobacteriota bacterium]
GQKVDDEELQRKKLIAEVAKLNENAKLARIKRMAEEGKYVKREDVEQELAGRGIVIDQTLAFHFQTKAGQLVELVKGDPGKVSDLVRELMQIKDEILNEFASTKEFEVIVGGKGNDL